MQTRLVLASALLALGPQDPPAPRPGAQDEDPTPVPFQDIGAERAAEVDAKLQGVWTLVDYRHRGLVHFSAPRGSAVFHEGFVSLFVTVEEEDVDFGDYEIIFQTGLYAYRLAPFGRDQRARLQTSALHGLHNLVDADVVDYEAPGYPREYQLEFAGEEDRQMRLISSTGADLVFERVETASFPERADELLRQNRVRGRFLGPGDGLGETGDR